MGGFNLADVLRGVSDMDTGTQREQIEYIDIDLLDSDERNFYALVGIDELAASIELCGLQQPIRVRAGDGERVVVVSGHRRLAALRQLLADGKDAYRSVPCIRERDEVSAEMQELRLIYANSSTRELTPAEVSHQAERVTALLYALKEQGVEFPGRMRDHVAEACNISKTKLARLNAIRTHLTAPKLREAFEAGALSESCAYELQRLPESAQTQIAKPAGVSAILAKDAATNYSEYESFCAKAECTHSPDGRCEHTADARAVKTVTAVYAWASCNNECCCSCRHAADCKQACDYAKARAKKDKEDAKAKKAEEEKAAADARAKEKARLERILIAQAKRYLPLMEAAGVSQLPGRCGMSVKTSFVRKWANGLTSIAPHYTNDPLEPLYTSDLVSQAKALHVSADWILGLTDDPTPADERATVSKPDPSAIWRDAVTDPPTEQGEYLLKQTAYDMTFYEPTYYSLSSKAWVVGDDAVCICWTSLPATPEVDDA